MALGIPSYHVLELKDQVPAELRAAVGDWLFGCDICQEVCPWNHSVPTTTQSEFQALESADPLDLIALFDLDDSSFRQRFRQTPLWRPKRRGLLRNAALILGNRPIPSATPALVRGLEDDDPLVRASCAWALGNYDSIEATRALAARLESETDPGVRDELEAAELRQRAKSPGDDRLC